MLRQKDLPHYLSDIEYTLRIRKLGLPIYRAKSAVAILDTATSGLKVRPGRSSPWQDIRDHLFDYRSPSNVITWMRFLRICCPRKYLPRWIWKVMIAEMKFIFKAAVARERM
jgi:GT2 family glycosyltransferase